MRIGWFFLFSLVAHSTNVSAGRIEGCEKRLCENTPTTRGCWGQYSIETNYYTTAPDTGNTVEVWLSVEESICNQDGYERPCMTFNGTMPGPPIMADWGDTLKIHVTNRMESNGTSVHWHGVHLRNSNEWDGSRKLDVGRITGTTVEDINVRLTHTALFQWTINSSSLVLDWNKPTLQQIFDDESVFPTPYNVVEVEKTHGDQDEWAVLVIENTAATFFGGIAHPIHFHGHDFWILAQKNTSWDGSSTSFQTTNPVRRDTAVLPAHGYLALAFQLDNPGAWLVHCHIAWHSSMGLALEFVESQDSISVRRGHWKTLDQTCQTWSAWSKGAPYLQDDSGI
ncbi:multicopper oxidase-domain-containing protein [Aspergillus coremiiformis]|uniref:Multicopper oxidase-domain-containing protein n=1 Tax=Aspergillus coremiiformis TaxID=138285 RepID=A0A5N6YV67_9EURO|nr:multicopper oxidase-domain-containing protein [Aspergillus coremiiformis]